MGTARSPSPCSCFGECVFLSWAPWSHRQPKAKHCNRSLSTSSWFYFLEMWCNIRLWLKTCGQGRMGWRTPVLLICLLTLLGLCCWGPTREQQSPWGLPALQSWGKGWGLRLKHNVSCSLDTSRLAPTSKGLLFLLIHKAILFYQKFGLIYIYTNIYINISIYTMLLLH